jgi:hypothetical protein
MKQTLLLFTCLLSFNFGFSQQPQSLLCNPNSIADSSFESGSPNSSWDETSTNFGTPLCTASNCGTGSGSGPRTGQWWAWFGGINTAAEEATVSQSVLIPSGTTATLNFYLEVPSCDGLGIDYFEIIIDSTDTVYHINDLSSLCGQTFYSLQIADLTTYADSNMHLVTFHGYTDDFIDITNFFVDDVSIIACPVSTNFSSIDLSQFIKISPNPVQDNFEITYRSLPSESLKIEITNLAGQNLYNRIFSCIRTGKIIIDVTDFSSGLYFVSLVSGASRSVEKITVR